MPSLQTRGVLQQYLYQQELNLLGRSRVRMLTEAPIMMGFSPASATVGRIGCLPPIRTMPPETELTGVFTDSGTRWLRCEGGVSGSKAVAASRSRADRAVR